MNARRFFMVSTWFSRAMPGAALAVALGVLSGQAQPVAVRTMAGASNPGSTNGYGSNARFNHPLALATDAAGNVYVGDTENDTIRKIGPGGGVTLLSGQVGLPGSQNGLSNVARFFGPQGLAIGTDRFLYVADAANHMIRKLNSSGTSATAAGAAGVSNSLDGSISSARFFHPESVAAGPDGNIYVADTWNHTIRKVTQAGVVSTLFGLAGAAGSADGTNSRPRFNRPGGIAVDSGTNIFVADTFNHTIRRISASGVVKTIAGIPGVWGSADGTNGNARFYLPGGVAVTPNGVVYVSDTGNQTVRQIVASGTNWIVTTVAGLSGIAGNATGTGTNARFSAPAGIAADSSGYLYVADAGNNIIRTTRVVPPFLQSFVVGKQLVTTWPTSSEGFTLQQSPAVGPLASWTDLASGVVTTGDNYFRTNSPAGTAYFRLRF